MEHRKELEPGEIVTCPECGSDDLNLDGLPDQVVCNKCGQEMQLERLLVWST
jgi:uncharacterized protein (DUF983 family)